MDKLRALAAHLPKAELHVHIEGTLQPELLFSLAQKNHVSIPYDSLDAVRAAYSFGQLDDFLKLYYQGMSVLIEKEDFAELAYAYAKRAREDNVVYAEVFFDPQGHLCRGVGLQTVYEGLCAGFDRAREELGMEVRLIFSFLRHLPEAECLQLVQDNTNPDSVYAQKLFAAKAFLAIGLDSSEKDYPPENFARLFAYCRNELKVPFAVAHAGEEGPPSFIKTSLEVLHVDRIDHGVACRNDAALREELKRRGVCLTVCPLSNVDLRVFPSKKACAESVLGLLREGLCVTLNSDDPAYFGHGAFAKAQYDLLIEHTGGEASDGRVTPEELKQLALNSFLGTFLSPEEKKKHCDRVEKVYAEITAP